MDGDSVAALKPIAHRSLSTIHPLRITSLSLHHFRNYASARIELSPQPVVLTGRNGAGKTNILEAISLLVPGRGLRRAKLSEMDHLPEGMPWTIAIQVSGIQGEVKIGTGRDPEPGVVDKRIVKIDGRIIRSQAELARHMTILWLTPQMEQLFNEGMSAGRKFMDRLVYGFDPEHAARVNEYEFAMRERNKLLGTFRSDPAWLDALESTMSETGAAIASARILASEHINHAIASSTLSFPKAHVQMHGVMEDGLKAGKAAVEVEENFKETLKAGRGQDAAAGRALNGPHRSELRVMHTEKQMPAEHCSTGEQKALLLSIILAEARAGLDRYGVVPVLLLDEVIAHLDTVRRHELFGEICQIGAQVWMTGTDAGLFMELNGKAQFFHVHEAHITPK